MDRARRGAHVYMFHMWWDRVWVEERRSKVHHQSLVRWFGPSQTYPRLFDIIHHHAGSDFLADMKHIPIDSSRRDGHFGTTYLWCIAAWVEESRHEAAIPRPAPCSQVGQTYPRLFDVFRPTARHTHRTQIKTIPDDRARRGAHFGILDVWCIVVWAGQLPGEVATAAR